MTKFYVNAHGVYIGGFDGIDPPTGGIEVPFPPTHGNDNWGNGAWIAALPIIPQQVSRRQARQALLLAGLLDHVPAKIAAISDPTARGMAQIEWDDSQIFERDRPLLITLASQLGLTSAQLDALFVHAATL